MLLKLHKRQAIREQNLLITGKFQNDDVNKKLYKSITQQKSINQNYKQNYIEQKSLRIINYIEQKSTKNYKTN